MPKLKTHRGAKKRFKISSGDKLLRRKAYSGHNLSKKRPSRKRSYAKDQGLDASEKSKVRRLLGV